MGKFRKPSLSLVLVVFFCLAATVGTVSAYTQISTNKNVDLTVANNAKFDVYSNNQYNFFSANQNPGQGLNALHISSDPTNLYGDITNETYTANTPGTFYLTDTGGRGWDDDGILMIAVNGSISELSNLNITITSSGYNWTPVTTGTYPAYNATTRDGIIQSFTASDFNSNTTGYSSTWKPCPYTNYAIYDGQNVANSSEFHIIFVDLHAGIIGSSTLAREDWSSANVINNGALEVTYTISGLPSSSMVAFDAYAFCNSSNQGQGIRWTNSVNTDGNRTTGTSGYNIASWYT